MRALARRTLTRFKESALSDSDLVSNLRMRLSPSASKGLLARFDRSAYTKHHVKRHNSKEVLTESFVEALFEASDGLTNRWLGFV